MIYLHTYFRSGELAQDFEEKKALMVKAQEDTTFTYHKKKGITMEKKEARAQKEEADRYQKLQDDLTKCQLEEQLFKLYHNEREIDYLSNELKNHQKNLNELVSYCNSLHTYICVKDLEWVDKNKRQCFIRRIKLLNALLSSYVYIELEQFYSTCFISSGCTGIQIEMLYYEAL